MWNVASRGSRYLAKKDDVGIAYISGSSASTFKELTTLIAMDAVTAMKMILSKPQFQWK
jgi:phosphatidate phosphatase APP1